MKPHELDAFLSTLRKHKVASWPTEYGPILLGGYAEEAGEEAVSPKKRVGDAFSPEAEEDDGEAKPFQLPDLDEDDGDPAAFLERIHKANHAPRVAK